MYCYGLRAGATFGDLMSRWRVKQKDDAYMAAHAASVRRRRRRTARVKKLPRALRIKVAEYAAGEGWNPLPPNTLDKPQTRRCQRNAPQAC